MTRLANKIPLRLSLSKPFHPSTGSGWTANLPKWELLAAKAGPCWAASFGAMIKNLCLAWRFSMPLVFTS